MNEMNGIFQKADWKSEKHVPIIEIQQQFKRGETGKVVVEVGKSIPHPNTTAHHIMWINLYFIPENSKFPYQIGNQDFLTHGASVEGPDSNTIYTHPLAIFTFKTDKPGLLLASSYCNIHGLWEYTLPLSIE
jgi:superoxide reductase